MWPVYQYFVSVMDGLFYKQTKHGHLQNTLCCATYKVLAAEITNV